MLDLLRTDFVAALVANGEGLHDGLLFSSTIHCPRKEDPTVRGQEVVVLCTIQVRVVYKSYVLLSSSLLFRVGLILLC